MKLYKIETGNLKLDGGAMFGVVPKVLWQKLYPADENNLANWAMRCLLVETDNRKILIDTGMGDKQNPKFFSYYYPNGNETLENSLKKNGFNFEDITDVILTHLHFDHVGGAVKYNKNRELVPTFPNAIYHISKTHWNLAVNPNRREKASFLPENFLPLQKHNCLNLITEEGEIIPGIEIKIYNGHTVGQMIPYITFRDKKIVFGADLFPSTAHIPMPYIMGYDTQPLITLKDKERFFDEAIKENQILFFEHDLYNECCSLEKTEKGVKVKNTFTLDDFIKN
ncbi:MAG: MBL fold metallo-hydrolase [Bacteroidetes bacterium]|nr:MAG: MBL fold metallo-hydrolase [Bacteroidota bacterium]